MNWEIEHRDENNDGINDCVVVLSKDFTEPLIGDYRGVVMAKILYTPSVNDSVQRAVDVAEMLVLANE